MFEYEYLSLAGERILFTTDLRHDEIDWEEVAQQFEPKWFELETSDAFGVSGYDTNPIRR